MTQGEDDHDQVKEKGLKQFFPSQPSGGTNLTNTLISDFLPPELGYNKFLLFKPLICGILLRQP